MEQNVTPDLQKCSGRSEQITVVGMVQRQGKGLIYHVPDAKTT